MPLKRITQNPTWAGFKVFYLCVGFVLYICHFEYAYFIGILALKVFHILSGLEVLIL